MCEEFCSVVMFDWSVMNHHIMENPVVAMFQIIAEDVANALILSSHPIDRLLTHDSPVTVLSFVHDVHV